MAALVKASLRMMKSLMDPDAKILYLTAYSDRLFEHRHALWANEALSRSRCRWTAWWRRCRSSCSDTRRAIARARERRLKRGDRKRL